MKLAKLQRNNAFNCRFKFKLSPDGDAMTRLFAAQQKELQQHLSLGSSKPGKLGMYLCLCCGFIHLGHERSKHRNAR